MVVNVVNAMQVSYMIVGQAENDIELSNEPDLDVGIEIPEYSKTQDPGSSKTIPPEDKSKKRRLRPKMGTFDLDQIKSLKEDPDQQTALLQL